jgi:hypothetical protein
LAGCLCLMALQPLPARPWNPRTHLPNPLDARTCLPGHFSFIPIVPSQVPPPPPFFLLLSPDKRRRNEPNPQSGFNVQQMPPKCANSRRLTPDHHHTCAGASQQCNKTKRRQLQRLTDRMLANIACVNSKCVKRQDRPGRSCKRTRDFTKVCCIFVNGSAIKVTDGKKKKRKRKRGGCTCTKHC